LKGIKPVVAGMIAATGLYIAMRCAVVNLGTLRDMSPDVRQIGIAAALGAFALVRGKVFKKGFSPILTILVSAALGVVVYGLR